MSEFILITHVLLLTKILYELLHMELIVVCRIHLWLLFTSIVELVQMTFSLTGVQSCELLEQHCIQ